jgi:hypothetical protein
MPIIDPRTEEPARDMLGHAIRGETQDLSALIQAVGGERYRQVLGLCLIAAAYVAVDVAGRWPTDADVRKIARLVSERGTEIPLDQQDVYDYLVGAALAFKSLPQAFGDDLAAATLPIFITGTLLFVPGRGKGVVGLSRPDLGRLRAGRSAGPGRAPGPASPIAHDQGGQGARHRVRLGARVSTQCTDRSSGSSRPLCRSRAMGGR